MNRSLTILSLTAAAAGFGLLPAPAGRAQPPVSTWVQPGADGRLAYKTDPLGNKIPDFSNVGYHGGGVRLPILPVKATVEPGPGDAGARIQAAIDDVSKLPLDANGWRGAVLLKKGRYPIEGTLTIRAGGVVLRGEGSKEGETLLVAAGTRQRSLIVVGRGAVSVPKDEDGGETASAAPTETHRPITDAYVPVGGRSFHVENTAGLAVGQEIIVKRPSPASWIHTIGMDRIPSAPDHEVVQWKPGTYDLRFSRVITALSGNEVTVDAPIVCALDQKFGGGEVLTGVPNDALAEVGVENLRGDSEFKGATDEKHGWILVDYAEVRNGWVRGVAALHFGYSCVFVRNACKGVTVDDCACVDPVSQITGGRRYCFALDGQLCLVQHCYARNGRHDFVMHARAPGPNVFFDCVAEQSHADSGPHHRWSVGVLYDNVRVSGSTLDARRSGGELNIRNRGSSGTGHGWAGANQVAWNCKAERMIIEQPPTAQNWGIGCITGSHSGNGYWESAGHPVQPSSLYLAQLKERLGSAPAADRRE